jgi:hypothetical protein
VKPPNVSHYEHAMEAIPLIKTRFEPDYKGMATDILREVETLPDDGITMRNAIFDIMQNHATDPFWSQVALESLTLGYEVSWQ